MQVSFKNQSINAHDFLSQMQWAKCFNVCFCNITNVGNVMGHGARGKIREKSIVKNKPMAGYF